MEDFDIFTNEIKYTKAFYKNILNRFVYDAPPTPNSSNYQSGRRLLAEECLAENDEAQCAFHFSEAVSSSIRTMAIYREEQRQRAGNNLKKITSYIKPIQELIDKNPINGFDKALLDVIMNDTDDVTNTLKKVQIDDELPFHKRYLKFTKENNVDNLHKILKELPKELAPKPRMGAGSQVQLLEHTDRCLETDCQLEYLIPMPRLHHIVYFFDNSSSLYGFNPTTCGLSSENATKWTVVQLTAPYNPNENLKPLTEYQKEIDSIYLTVYTNDYLEQCGVGPFTVNVPANVNKEGEKPLFIELYSILEENYKTIDNAQFLNNKRLVQNYWNRREDIDLRMKSVINVMEKQWLGGWGCLLTGRLIDQTYKEKVVRAVDDAIADWGFIRLTKKQKLLLYNLIESCATMSSHQIKSCIRIILTEHGNPDDIRQVLQPCENCTKEFKFVNEVCLKCLSRCFEVLHHFSLVDGIRAFSKVATLVRDGDEWTGLKKAKRHPVILIVDEILDTFPWESLPILNQHPVSRIENVHFLYYLYKMHEKSVVNGYFTTKGHDGRYIINPEKNLDRMEKRMSSFVKYWCSDWKGYISEPPPPEQFIDYLTNSDIFLYCGHGDGCQFANGAPSGSGVESAVGAAVCVLAGCGSARLSCGPARGPPTAAHRRLHLAGSPCVVGMLWEVTDLEVDKVVSSLLALCIPSSAPAPWQAVRKDAWSRGEIDTTNVDQKCQFVSEPDILRGISRARASSNYVMISSSTVARGLPVRVT